MPVEQHQAARAATRRFLCSTLRSHVNVRSCRFLCHAPILGPVADIPRNGAEATGGRRAARRTITGTRRRDPSPAGAP
ncbi:hypothetical protein KNE206_14970 [Kitasatospora sp. NE20-6]